MASGTKITNNKRRMKKEKREDARAKDSQKKLKKLKAAGKLA